MRKSDFTLPTLDDLFSTQAERDDAKLERVRNIPLAELHPFKGHPFKVKEDEEMAQLMRSIADAGVLSPAGDSILWDQNATFINRATQHRITASGT